jgi:hypothetical protein
VLYFLHELNDETKNYFFNAVESVKTQNTRPDNLIIVVPKDSEVEKYVLGFYGDYTVASNPGLTDFASQVNYGVSVAKTEWVSVLEFDDELANI